MINISRTAIALSAAAAALTFASCDESGLPITQTVEGAKFEYVIPAGTEAKEAFTLDRTVAVRDIRAQLAALGIDNVTLESVEVNRLDISFDNAEDLSPEAGSFVSMADVESLDVSFDDLGAGSEGVTTLLLASLAPDTYAATDVAASLQVLTGVNLLRFLGQDEVTARAEVKLKAPVTLEEDLKIGVVLDYEVTARVNTDEAE